MALDEGKLIDISPVTSEAGFGCPVAVSRELWRRHGNTREIDLRSANVISWLAKAMMQVAAGRRIYSESQTPFGVNWHFRFEYMPEEDNWTTVTVKCVLGPDDDGHLVATVLLSTEESTQWELGLRPENYSMLREDISVLRDADGLTVRFHASGIERLDLSHFRDTFGAKLFDDPDGVTALIGRLRYEFEGYDDQLRPIRRDLPPLWEFLRKWHGYWPYWFLMSDFESDTPVNMFRQAFPGIRMMAGNASIPNKLPAMIRESGEVIRLECNLMTSVMEQTGHRPSQIARRMSAIVDLLQIPGWVVDGWRGES